MPLIRRRGGQLPLNKSPSNSPTSAASFASPTLFVSFCSDPPAAAGGGHEPEEGVAYIAEILPCVLTGFFANTCCINISGSDLFGDIGRPTTGNGAVHIVVLCPTPWLPLNLLEMYFANRANIFTNFDKSILRFGQIHISRPKWQWGISTHCCPVCYAWVAIEPA